MYVHMYVCFCMYVCTYVGKYLCMYLCSYVRIYLCDLSPYKLYVSYFGENTTVAIIPKAELRVNNAVLPFLTSHSS